MSKIYKTILTPDYLLDWSVADGIREHLSNALDSSGEMVLEVTDGCISIGSKGVTLPPKVLTLGTSGSRAIDENVGRHGEGILTSLIPILREGGSVVFLNGGIKWIPRFEYDVDFEREVLVIEETSNTYAEDFTVVIYTDNDSIEEAVGKCLYTKPESELGEIWEGQRGRVFDGFAGQLYVGGIWVCEIKDPKFSYDFKPKYLPINRDRKQMDTWDICKNTSILLADALSSKQVVELINNGNPSISYLGYTLAPQEGSIADELFEDFVDTHGEDAILCEYYSEQQELEKSGYKNVVVARSGTQYRVIKNSAKYEEHLEKVTEETQLIEKDERSPIELLEAFEENNELFGSQENFSKLLELFKQRGVSFDDSSAHDRNSVPF